MATISNCKIKIIVFAARVDIIMMAVLLLPSLLLISYILNLISSNLLLFYLLSAAVPVFQSKFLHLFKLISLFHFNLTIQQFCYHKILIHLFYCNSLFFTIYRFYKINSPPTYWFSTLIWIPRICSPSQHNFDINFDDVRNFSAQYQRFMNI